MRSFAEYVRIKIIGETMVIENYETGQAETKISPHAAVYRAGALDATKFINPDWTEKGEKRARVPFGGYETLWFNTGTLCNIACQNCYIDSSPKNDRLAYLTLAEVRQFLDEAQRLAVRPSEIGYTGGEPFMNPDIVAILGDSLVRGFRVLVLTNAMKPMYHKRVELLELSRAFPDRLSVRVSIDHHRAREHEQIRGAHTWEPMIEGINWLAQNGFDLSVAGRTGWGETEANMRAGYANLFTSLGLAIDAGDPSRLVLFPELDEQADVPEITERCWGILGKNPSDIMCASSRMVVKRKGAVAPAVVSCTLLAYAPEFEMGATLAEAARSVSLNHRHCARFCVLGGASCSAPSRAHNE